MKYIITSARTNTSIRLSYNDSGVIEQLTFNEHDANQANWTFKNMPAEEENLQVFCKEHKLRLDHVPTDVSFQSFWTAFKYKVGKKKRAEKLWNAMSEMQRQVALNVIPRYHRFIAFKNQESAYPETWLNNDMWENDYILK
jgi:hypothetical protein